MRVLVATLIKQLYGRTLQGLFQQDWSGPTEYLFVKNDQPAEHPYDRVTALYQQVRDRFLAGPYDALLTVEADMLIPPHALSRLLACDADVAYGLYVWRHGTHHRWSAYQVAHDGALRSIWELDQHAARGLLAQGATVPVAGVGLGCTLIRRHVLEQLPFRRAESACNDWYLAVDCRFAGMRQVCDLGVVCGHITNWPVLRVLWPDGEAPHGWRSEVIDPRITEEAHGEEITRAASGDRDRAGC